MQFSDEITTRVYYWFLLLFFRIIEIPIIIPEIVSQSIRTDRERVWIEFEIMFLRISVLDYNALSAVFLVRFSIPARIISVVFIAVNRP